MRWKWKKGGGRKEVEERRWKKGGGSGRNKLVKNGEEWVKNGEERGEER